MQKLAGVGTLPAHHEGAAAHSCNVGVLWLTVKLAGRHRFCSRFSHFQIFVQFFLLSFSIFLNFPPFLLSFFFCCFITSFVGRHLAFCLSLQHNPGGSPLSTLSCHRTPLLGLTYYFGYCGSWGGRGFHSLPCHSTKCSGHTGRAQ